MIGVISIGPRLGITDLNGLRIGSLMAYDHRIHGEYGEIGSHELMTLTRSAMRMKLKVHATSSLKMPPGQLRIASASPTTSPRIKSRTLMSRIPPITTAASAHNGAVAGFPPAFTTFLSIGSSTGSIFERQKRASAPNTFTRLVRTSQSMRQKTAN